MTSVVAPRKSLGQHWLSDEASLQAMCDAADVKADDTILEIGPGTGELTARLLKRGAHVVAVELDDGLADTLQKRFLGLPFTLNMLSIFDYDLSKLPADYKIAANIPFYLTNHLLRMLCESQHKPVTSSLLVQREVAARIAAKPGEMSLSSVSVQLYYEVSLGQVVPAKLFTPAPKVDSQILILKRRPKPLFEVNPKRFFRLVKAGFSSRRKTLHNALAGGLQITKLKAVKLLNDSGLNPQSRAQELSLDEWYKLYNQYQRVRA